MGSMRTTPSADSLALVLRSLKLPTVARLAEAIAQQAENALSRGDDGKNSLRWLDEEVRE
jgi:hypothetical protein